MHKSEFMAIHVLFVAVLLTWEEVIIDIIDCRLRDEDIGSSPGMNTC